MNTANKTIQNLQTEEILVDIFTDNYDESLYGYILNYNENFLLLEHYDDDGLYNGFVIFRRQDITRLRWGNNDLNSISSVINRQNQTKNLKDIQIDSIENILTSVEKSFGYFNVRIQDINTNWSIIGELQEMDSKNIVIKEFGTRATLDRGMLMISLDEITRIEADGNYENSLMKIHKKNN